MTWSGRPASLARGGDLSAQTVTWYVRPPPCSLVALSACGGGLEGPHAIAFFDRHGIALDMVG